MTDSAIIRAGIASINETPALTVSVAVSVSVAVAVAVAVAAPSGAKAPSLHPLKLSWHVKHEIVVVDVEEHQHRPKESEPPRSGRNSGLHACNSHVNSGFRPGHGAFQSVRRALSVSSQNALRISDIRGAANTSGQMLSR
jgi:hypothetical protein